MSEKALKVFIDDVEYVPKGAEAQPPTGGLPEGYVSDNFREAEFDCNHCGKYGDLISMELVELLEKVRSHFSNNIITVNSGVRCDFHNQAVGGADESRHKTKYADAADIVVSNALPEDVASYLEGLDPGRYGIGRYSSFTHIDVRGYSARWGSN